MQGWPEAFPIDDFNVRFPEFSATGTVYTQGEIMNAGLEAMMHITPPVEGMPLEGPYREYALFLLTAHIAVLNKQTASATTSGGNAGTGLVFRSTVGSVTVEQTKPNSYNADDWTYWLSQTAYGQKYAAFLDSSTPVGVIYPNETCGLGARDLM